MGCKAYFADMYACFKLSLYYIIYTESLKWIYELAQTESEYKRSENIFENSCGAVNLYAETNF